MRSTIIFYNIIFYVFSSIFLIAYFVAKNRLHNKINNCTQKTIATIVSKECRKWTWYDTSNYPTRRYKYNSVYLRYSFYINGIKYVVRSNTGIDYLDYLIDQKVILYYNMNNPNEIYIPDEHEEKVGSHYLLIGCIFLFLSIFTTSLIIYVNLL